MSIPAQNVFLHSIIQHYHVDGQDGVLNPVGMLGHKLEDRSRIRDAQDPRLLEAFQKASTVSLTDPAQRAMFVVAHRGGMLDKPLPQDVYRYGVLESAMPVIVFLVSIPFAFLSHYAAYACWATLLLIEPVIARRRPADADAYLP